MAKIQLTDNQPIVGLLPAGGRATRISPLPCSKELFPIGFTRLGKNKAVRPKAAAHYLLEKMHAAGAVTAFIVLRKGKWDIPAYFGDGSLVALPLSYIVVEATRGVPFTVNAAFPFIAGKRVIFGFPDILFQPVGAYRVLLNHLNSRRADIVLGLFPAADPCKMDMVELDRDGKVQKIVIKPEKTDLTVAWIIAAWAPRFSVFLREFVSRLEDRSEGPMFRSGRMNGSETHMGQVIDAAVREGMTVENVIFDKGWYLDIGTPEDLQSAVRHHGRRPDQTESQC